MAEVFISWGLPDASPISRLCERLTGLGIGLFEYSQDMAAGDKIPDRIQDEIRQATIAIVCLSDQTAQRQWIVTEIAWSDAALRDEGARLKDFVAVQTGPLAEANVPVLITDRSRYIFDLADRADSEQELQKLTVDLIKRPDPRLPSFTQRSSMALVNVGEILADLGARVVLCDWDLEAPGLDRYVVSNQRDADELKKQNGLMDLLLEYKGSLKNPSGTLEATSMFANAFRTAMAPPAVGELIRPVRSGREHK